MFPATLSVSAQKSLALLGKSKILEKAYLAGGSSLALQIGHRRSIDFDFFSKEEPNIPEIKKQLNTIGKYQPETETPKTMAGQFNDIKFSYFFYPYPLIRSTTRFLQINLCSIEDIAAMKLVAITDRGTKKDYIDLYFLIKKFFSFEELFQFYDKKYKLFETNKLTLLKALSYFDDADNSSIPEMIEKINWEEVKEFFQKEVVRLAEKYIL